MSLAALLAGAERAPGRLAVDMPPDWMQGRTVYGGLSVGLAYEAARTCTPDLAPLRSIQVAFVGPLAGRIEVSAEVLRRGRSASFVQAEVRSEAGLGLRATFLFSAGRTSSLAFENAAASEAPDPEAAAPALRRSPANFFTRHFEYRHALPKADAPTPEFRLWVRLVAREGFDPTTGLLTLADALPPAAMAMMGAPGPVSSATWMMTC